jgi:hypothetical protein
VEGTGEEGQHLSTWGTKAAGEALQRTGVGVSEGADYRQDHERGPGDRSLAQLRGFDPDLENRIRLSA